VASLMAAPDGCLLPHRAKPTKQPSRACAAGRAARCARSLRPSHSTASRAWPSSRRPLPRRLLRSSRAATAAAAATPHRPQRLTQTRQRSTRPSRRAGTPRRGRCRTSWQWAGWRPTAASCHSGCGGRGRAAVTLHLLPALLLAATDPRGRRACTDRQDGTAERISGTPTGRSTRSCSARSSR
jgi:hypothetical protein